MCSSHASEGSKLYRSFHCFRGGLSKVHIPSSANNGSGQTTIARTNTHTEIVFIDHSPLYCSLSGTRWLFPGEPVLNSPHCYQQRATPAANELAPAGRFQMRLTLPQSPARRS